MIQWTDELKKQFRAVQIMSFIVLVPAPIIYIFVAFQLNVPLRVGGQFDIMFNILLFVAMVQPTINPLIEKFQISTYKKTSKYGKVNSNFPFKRPIQTPFLTQPPKGTPMGLFMIVTIIKSAVVEAIYVYGMVVLFTSGDITRMLYFYPIGIAWSLVYFPTKSRCEKFLEKVSSNATV